MNWKLYLYLALVHKKYVIVPIDKASNNFVFIYKNFYVSKLLSEISNNNSTYLHIDKEGETIISENIKFYEKFGLKNYRTTKKFTTNILDP